MAAGAGRRVRVKVGGTDVAGARTDTLTINNTPIDITDKDDAGVRTYLDDIGTKSLDMSVEGVLINGTLMDSAQGAGTGTALSSMSFAITGIGTFAGNFFISSFETAGSEGDEPNTFSMSVQSGTSWTYTATA